MPSRSSRWSEYRHQRRVQFHEVDGAGIVHFSWFFRYMEEAEHALWRAAGLSIAPPASDVVFPRVAASFDYRRPLRFEDEFEVCIRVAAISEKTITYECLLTREGELLATGTMTTACVGKARQPMKAIPIPPEIATRFEVAAGAAAPPAGPGSGH
jgi:acyl-CoA thioester hydrolase